MNSDKISQVLTYVVNGSTRLRGDWNTATIKDVTVEFISSSAPTMSIDINSLRSVNVSIVVGTSRFSRVFDAEIVSGDNHLEFNDWPFSDERDYERYLSERCDIMLIEDDGEILYSCSTRIDAQDVLLPFTLTVSSTLLIVAFLIWRSNPVRLRISFGS